MKHHTCQLLKVKLFNKTLGSVSFKILTKLKSYKLAHSCTFFNIKLLELSNKIVVAINPKKLRVNAVDNEYNFW